METFFDTTVLNAPSPRVRAREKSPWPIALIVGGLLVRFFLAVVCWGTNDATTFARFGYLISRVGLLQAYHTDSQLNHPPIPAIWAEVAWRLTASSPPIPVQLHWDRNALIASAPWFSAVFKIPVLLAECATCWLLYRIWKDRAGTRRGLAVAAMYAWALDAILVSGYHCNTDSIYAFFCLLSVYLAQDRKLHFGSGVALAAAINIKLTPVLLLPPLLLAYRDWRKAGSFLGGISLGIAPFVPVFYFAGHSFYANGIAYQSNLDRWGMNYLFMLLGRGLGEYRAHGRLVVVGLIGAWALAARIWDQTNRYELAAVAFAIFLFFTPGFGVQYTVMALPLMFAVRPGLASLYGLLSGLFLFVVYWAYWTGHGLVVSQFERHGFPAPSGLWGLVAWASLGIYLSKSVSKSAEKCVFRAKEPLLIHAIAP
jgi:hypothetical protein